MKYLWVDRSTGNGDVSGHRFSSLFVSWMKEKVKDASRKGIWRKRDHPLPPKSEAGDASFSFFKQMLTC